MYLRHLRVENLRSLESVGLDFVPGWNLLIGPNGAGKTSVLEAAFLLSHGRSFRTSVKEALIRRGSAGFSVFGELDEGGLGPIKVGISRTGGRLEARLDGNPVAAAELMRHVAVVCFEPGSHELMSGSSEARRRYIDWGVFHVEHDFLGLWRRYQRALKQRNALLRNHSTDDELDAWDRELVLAAEPLTLAREAYFERLVVIARTFLLAIVPELGTPQVRFEQGYPLEHPLEEHLRRRREWDRARGFSGAGPHRADWHLTFLEAPRRDHLSRGQEKLAAFAMIMAQARLYAEVRGVWPVLCFDDLASEVDAAHQQNIVAVASTSGAQILATSTHPLEGVEPAGAAMFHVEQGRVSRLL